jgi:ADP-ribosylglycohydrolase
MFSQTEDRFEGCLLGLALGDALGAPLEGGPIERLVWRVLGLGRGNLLRWSDDTQMSLDLAEGLIAEGTADPDDLARRFAASYRWSRGYGPGAARILKRIRRGADWRLANRSVFPDGSFGNGAGMRAPMVGLFHASRPELLPAAARSSAEITHAHPLGMEGALHIATATAQALTQREGIQVMEAASRVCALAPFVERCALAHDWLEAGASPSPSEVAEVLGNGIAAAESCVTAVYLAARFMDQDFGPLMAFVVDLGGDVDTLGAMSGAIWGAANGATALPPQDLARLEQRERLSSVAAALYRASEG